jgi:hypothetical protein
MAKKRYINTKFWSDTFIVELNPLDRYLFLYLLTNEHTDICGIYELPWRVMARESGLEDEMLQKMFKRLDEKVYYIDGYIYIKNFAKHQAVNESIELGIKRSIALIPDNIIAKIKEIDTGCTQTGDNLPPSSDLLKPKPILKPKPKNMQPEVADESNNQIVFIFNLFKTINPTISYGNKTNRQAIKDLIRQFGYEKTVNTVNYAISIQGIQYAPTITNPYQLKTKMGDLLVYYKKDNSPRFVNI